MTITAPAPGHISGIQSICVFDLETSGVDVFNDRIVTAYLGRLNAAGEVTGSYSWLVNPGVEIPEGAIAVHGVSNEVAQRDGQDPSEAVGEMLAVLRRSIAAGRPVVAYNASFDLSMLNAEAERYGHDPIDDFGIVVDPLIIDKTIDKYRKGKRTLSVTAPHYGVVLDGAHDAEADAVATGRVALAVLAAAHKKLGDMTLSELHDRQITWAEEGAASFQEYKRRTGDPAFTTDGSWPVRRRPSTAPVPAVSSLAAQQGRVPAGNGDASGEFTEKLQSAPEVNL